MLLYLYVNLWLIHKCDKEVARFLEEAFDDECCDEEGNGGGGVGEQTTTTNIGDNSDNSYDSDSS